MMSLSSLYLLFFAITVSAFAPTEAGSEPVAANNSAGAPSPVTFALLADQQQQNNKVTPVQKESPVGPGQQKKTPLANVLATAGAAAVILALLLFFMKQMKGYLEKEKEGKPEEVPDRELTPEEELAVERAFIAGEIGFEDEAKTVEERKVEAKRRIQAREVKYNAIRWAAGSEGKTEGQLRKEAFKEEAYQRALERGKRYNYKVNREEQERDAEDEWKRREGIKKKLLRGEKLRQ